MRLIDADKLMTLFVEKAYKVNNRHGVKIGEKWLLDYDDIKDVIEHALTENAITEDAITVEELDAWLRLEMDDNAGNNYADGCEYLLERTSEVVPFCKYRRERLKNDKKLGVGGEDDDDDHNE